MVPFHLIITSRRFIILPQLTSVSSPAVPRFLSKYTTPLRNAPITHITSFLLLHELTAVAPLFALAGFFHYSRWMPPLVSEGKLVSDGVEKFGNYFRRKGWLGQEDKRRYKWWGRGEGATRIVVEYVSSHPSFRFRTWEPRDNVQDEELTGQICYCLCHHKGASSSSTHLQCLGHAVVRKDDGHTFDWRFSENVHQGQEGHSPFCSGRHGRDRSWSHCAGSPCYGGLSQNSCRSCKGDGNWGQVATSIRPRCFGLICVNISMA